MKTIMLFFIAAIMADGCDRDNTGKMRGTVIEYEAVSRGFYLNVLIKGDYVQLRDKRDGASRDYTLAGSKLQDVAALYNKTDISKLPEYKDPTQKRFYDGAAIATLSVTEKGKTFSTVSFDHGDPPVEIAELVNKIVSLATE